MFFLCRYKREQDNLDMKGPPIRELKLLHAIKRFRCTHSLETNLLLQSAPVVSFRNYVTIFELETVQAPEVKSPLEFEKKKRGKSKIYKVVFAYVKYQ